MFKEQTDESYDVIIQENLKTIDDVTSFKDKKMIIACHQILS